MTIALIRLFLFEQLNKYFRRHIELSFSMKKKNQVCPSRTFHICRKLLVKSISMLPTNISSVLDINGVSPNTNITLTRRIAITNEVFVVTRVPRLDNGIHKIIYPTRSIW